MSLRQRETNECSRAAGWRRTDHAAISSPQSPQHSPSPLATRHSPRQSSLLSTSRLSHEGHDSRLTTHEAHTHPSTRSDFLSGNPVPTVLPIFPTRIATVEFSVLRRRRHMYTLFIRRFTLVPRCQLIFHETTPFTFVYYLIHINCPNRGIRIDMEYLDFVKRNEKMVREEENWKE